MLFQSQIFILVFLPITLALYYATAGSRTLRQIVVVTASLIFYGAWDVRFVPLLVGLTFSPWDIILPLGISFFVFQKISYLVDLRRGQAHAYPLLDFFMFVTFFPQLSLWLPDLLA